MGARLHSKTDSEGEYQPIRVFDILPGESLPFDVYLFMPLNKKYLRYLPAGEAITPEQFTKLTEHGMGSVFVKQQDKKKFYEYAAAQLQPTVAGPQDVSEGSSETERRQKVQEKVKSLFKKLLPPEGEQVTAAELKEISEEVGSIVRKTVESISKDGLYAKILRQLGDSATVYSHASNVSTLGALFSIGIGLGKPDQVATAALFHDLGEEKIPEALRGKSYGSLSPKDRPEFEAHVAHTVALIGARDIQISPEALAVIEMHHERFDGNGFPKKIKGDAICIEAQLLAFADEFDELTRFEEGWVRYSPKKALKKIEETAWHDPALVAKIKKLFP